MSAANESGGVPLVLSPDSANLMKQKGDAPKASLASTLGLKAYYEIDETARFIVANKATKVWRIGGWRLGDGQTWTHASCLILFLCRLL
jgi:hypothetical protein